MPPGGDGYTTLAVYGVMPRGRQRGLAASAKPENTTYFTLVAATTALAGGSPWCAVTLLRPSAWPSNSPPTLWLIQKL